MSSLFVDAIFVKTIGQGPDLVMLHGWGCNTKVWQAVVEPLSQHFKLHLVDLPGFGHSAPLNEYHLPALAQAVARAVPNNAIWLGWSLGGLVAMQAALLPSIELSGLITLASSPCFQAQEPALEKTGLGPWPGIKPEVLLQFHQQLLEDPKRTLNNFLALQAMGSRSVKADIKQLKSALESSPEPHLGALDAGLNLLQTCDLRTQIHHIHLPWLRLYGRRDALVPKKVLAMVDQLASRGESFMFNDSAHAPFITEIELFVNKVIDFYHGHIIKK